MKTSVAITRGESWRQQMRKQWMKTTSPLSLRKRMTSSTSLSLQFLHLTPWLDPHAFPLLSPCLKHPPLSLATLRPSHLDLLRLRAIKDMYFMFLLILHVGLKTHLGLYVGLKSFIWASICSSNYALSSYSYVYDCLLLVNVWQPF